MGTDKKEYKTLQELWIGIFVWGILSEVAGILFWRKAILSYSTGILLGIISASAMAYHMLRSLDQGLSLSEEACEKYMRKQGIIRYLAAIVIMAGVMMCSKWINPLSWFLALMGLKVAAYLQPLTHRFVLGKKGIQLEKEEEEALQREYAEKLLEEEETEEEELDE